MKHTDILREQIKELSRELVNARRELRKAVEKEDYEKRNSRLAEIRLTTAEALNGKSCHAIGRGVGKTAPTIRMNALKYCAWKNPVVYAAGQKGDYRKVPSFAYLRENKRHFGF